MVKIKNIDINGLRGIKKKLQIDLAPTKSLLIFGDSGSGKSSITDALEWFYFDKIEHLSIEEIGRKGIEALRNLFLSHTVPAYIALQFSKARLNSQKKIYFKKSKLVSEIDNTDKNYTHYIENSQKERLILRYRSLGEFILKSKAEKMQEISGIIGFEEVSKYQGIFKKAVNDLRRDIKNKNFENQISIRKGQLLEQLNQQVNNDKQYFKAIQDLISPLNLNIKIKNHKDIGAVLETIKQPEDKSAVALQLSYDRVITSLETLSKSLNNFIDSVKRCYDAYESISKDASKLGKISLERLLSEGLSLLEKKQFTEDKCPLCLQNKDRAELIDEIKSRIAELQSFKKEKEKFILETESTGKLLETQISGLSMILNEKSLSLPKELNTKSEIQSIKQVFEEASYRLGGLFRFDIAVKEADKHLRIDSKKINQLIKSTKKSKNELTIAKKDDARFTIYANLESAREKFSDIKTFEEESSVLNAQLETMDIVYSEFNKRQREGLINFLKSISKDINDFYAYMNPDERVDEIELIPLGEEDTLVGVSIEFKFHGKIVSPPNRFLSESHLNCLGICLFLSSVKAFNKENKFFVLDDVISSFDKNHRLKFARLLLEKFSDYQILLFTHEDDWFEYVSNMVKSNGWIITKMIWDNDNGASLASIIPNLRNRIEDKIQKSDSSELGNMLRKHLEHILKNICFNIEAKTKFLYNDRNEDRMCHELLSAIRGEIKNRKSNLTSEKVFERIDASNFLGRKASHDSKFRENISDLKVFHQDINELEKLFYCDEKKCGKCISMKNYDNVNKEIRCDCGNRKYKWIK